MYRFRIPSKGFSRITAKYLVQNKPKNLQQLIPKKQKTHFLSGL